MNLRAKNETKNQICCQAVAADIVLKLQFKHDGAL